ncbi:hypothetical protein KY343_03720 [Candidatus Woesearchaeota archaeon]|nr:hypothetical protein [Candidatus Woesearchaeota archaeon]
MVNRNYDGLMDWVDSVIDPEGVLDDTVSLEDFQDRIKEKVERQMTIDGAAEARKRGMRSAIRQLNSGFGPSELIRHRKADAWERARDRGSIGEIEQEIESEWDKTRDAASEIDRLRFYPEEDLRDMPKGQAIAHIAVSRRTTMKRARLIYKELYG